MCNLFRRFLFLPFYLFGLVLIKFGLFLFFPSGLNLSTFKAFSKIFWEEFEEAA
jgi:hypothetical protein|tara:strand:- start:339 stop:500 length:162 start_codon:yes stop_codon:yes gene_type:complete